MTKSNDYLERIKALQQSLNELDGFFINNPIDLYYYTGMRMSCGHLYVLKKSSCLFVDRRYLEAAVSESAVAAIEIGSANEAAFLKGCKHLGFDGSFLTHDLLLSLRKTARKGHIKLLSRPVILRNLRMVKSPGEIRKMQRSAELSFNAYQFIRKKLKTGVTELELARKLELYCLEQGAEKMSFEPIIAFGKNSALPHHHPGAAKLKKNDIALFDLGVILDGYCSDMTRVDFVGKEDPQLRRLFDVNRAAQRMALAKCKPGVKVKELDIAARRVMKSADLEHLFIHSLGHGVGLEIHEGPSIRFDGPDRNLVLQEGMVITIEPGLYQPGKGGVRYEDTVVITKKGYTNFYPEGYTKHRK